MEWNGIVDGLKEAITQAVSSKIWKPVGTLLEASVPSNSIEYKQLMEIKQSDELFENVNIVTESCKRGYTELMQVILSNSLSPNYIVKHPGKTLLHYAAYGGHLSLVKLLLNTGACVNCKIRSKYTPLYKAAQQGHLDVVKHLISAGADTNIHSSGGETVLSAAIKCNSYKREEIVQLLLDSGYVRNEKNAYPGLCNAVIYGNINIVKMMLDAGFYVNGTKDFIPLHIAARGGDITIMQLLLKYGADINLTNSEGNSALHEVLRDFKYKSLSPKTLDIVKFLIEHSILINSKNRYGVSPLLLSIDVNAFDVALVLINSGADMDSDNHLVLLHRALRECAPVELIECLLEHGANVATIYNKKTALQYVLFYDWRININWKLHVAKLMLIYGSDHYVQDRNGGTVLHWACKVGDVELVKYLIDYGLDVNAKNREGKKPYDIAREKGHTNIVKVIIEYHCNKYMYKF